ncbi:glycosyltransferase family 4 protein [Coraliomargarita parva]|uniref:glycosyltransferase family 4 protein n=1 Tax=Coraliomargarita parva TaxID=3014050 RepID=UPI0022B2D1F9|nr:glycosyltransferase family 4 protein [Coraliomargarita parva]
MRIWIFNPYDDIPGEGKSQRFWALAQVAAEMGHEVVWWSSDFSHRRKVQRAEQSVQHVAKEPSSMNFALRLVKTPAYSKNISLARVWNHRAYGKGLYHDAVRAIDAGELAKPDVILASLPPMEGAISALRLRQRYGCKVVTDIMDAWPETLLQAFPRGLRPLGRILLWPYWRMLRTACVESDGLSAQSHTFADFAMQHGAEARPYVCYLGAEKPKGCGNEEAVRDSKALRLLYLGAMGRSYDLETILEAVRLAREAGVQVECVFVGDGEKRAALEASAVEGVRFTGYLQGDALASEMSAADVGLVPFFPESGVAVPYKAGDYLAYGMPLLSTIDGELGALIRKYACGGVYQAGSPEALSGLICRFAKDRETLLAAKQGARACFDGHFDRSQIYPAFAKWIVSLVDSSPNDA